MKVITAITIVFGFAGSLYLGCGGITSLELSQQKTEIEKMVIDARDTIPVIFDTLEFQNLSAAKIFKEDRNFEKRYQLAISIFPWLNLPYTFLGLLITSFAFGFFGGIVGILKEIVLEDKPIEKTKVFSSSLLGGGAGIIILSISFILPIIIVTGETEVRSLSIVLASLFGGLFNKRFFEWLSSIFGKIFKD